MFRTLKLEPAKYLRLFSDIHLDMGIPKGKFSPNMLWKPDSLPEDKDTALVLAGDLWHAKKPFSFGNNKYSWMAEIASRFKYVFVVLGNHDFWDGQLPTEYANFERYAKEANLDNVFVLQKDIVLMGDYKFIGATFWVNYGKNPEFMGEAEKYSDFRFIRYADPRFPNTFKKLKARNVIDAHNNDKRFVFENAKRDYPEQKVWVFTHHPPTFALVDDPSLTEFTASVSATDYDEEIKSSEIDVWMHGHNHQSGEAMVGNTRIIANTLGYVTAPDENAKLNPKFNPWFQMKL